MSIVILRERFLGASMLALLLVSLVTLSSCKGRTDARSGSLLDGGGDGSLEGAQVGESGSLEGAQVGERGGTLLWISAESEESELNGGLSSLDGANVGESREMGLPEVELSYAEGFSLERHDNYMMLTIRDPQGESSTEYHFALVERGSKVDTPEGVDIIELPVERVICMTELQLSAFIRLGNLSDVCGISSGRHIFNEEVKRRVEEGEIEAIGIEGDFDPEVILSIDPDIILTSPFKRGGTGALTDVGVLAVPYLGYKESTPLGQAEWIKFVGLMTGRYERAERIFRETEEHYEEIKAIASKAESRPTVYSGEPRGGIWYVVGGESFLANLFRDAGAEYFLKDDKRTGGVNLDFEYVYGVAQDIDYWRIMNSFHGEFSYDVLLAEDRRYADFKAVREHHVIYCNMRYSPFYEASPMEPEYVLADMVKAFHPELLPDYTPHFYRVLSE